jgi:hypothetical protein
MRILILGNAAGLRDGDHRRQCVISAKPSVDDDHTGRETVRSKRTITMRSFFFAAVVSFAATAALCAIAAVTVWL